MEDDAATRDRPHVMRPDPFEALGFAPGDALSRAALFEQATRAFRDRTGGDPQWRWFVPGRIEIFGKHTDYAGGRSLLCAVPRGLAVVAAPRQDELVRVIDGRRNEATVVVASAHGPEMTGWGRYVAAAARRLARNFPGAHLGTDIALASDLPRAAGLSSSSALIVAVATAVIRRGGLEARDEWREAIRTPYDLAGYLGAVENGQTFGALAGAAGVGTHGGSEDHTAILTCRTGRVSGYAFVPVRHLGDALMPGDWRFVVASSGVVADKAGGARDSYNRASLATRALVDIWNARVGDQCATLADVLSRAPEAAERLLAAIAGAAASDFDHDVLARRLRHFVAEDGRVPPALQAFHAADSAALSALARASQDDADALLGNQVDETRALAGLAAGCGAFGATSFGAGFGGSVWALAPAADAAAVGARWVETYRRQVPSVRHVDWFVAAPGPAITELAIT
jgi:galactokinase